VAAGDHGDDLVAVDGDGVEVVERLKPFDEADVGAVFADGEEDAGRVDDVDLCPGCSRHGTDDDDRQEPDGHGSRSRARVGTFR